MRWLRLLPAVLLLVAAISLRPLAEANPPDPTWIGGLYDNGDLDDIVLAVTSTAAVLDARPAERAEPTLVVVGAVREAGMAAFSPRARLSHQPRSPPTP